MGDDFKKDSSEGIGLFLVLESKLFGFDQLGVLQKDVIVVIL